MHYSLVTSALLSGVAAASLIQSESNITGPTCRYIPGDEGWPSATVWQSLNASVEGRLIATNPIAHVCHAPTYSAAECAIVTENWDLSSYMDAFPADIMNPWWQNQSCVPSTSETTPCALGNLASYSINVTSVDDIVTGLEFAKENNVRLVIKNSGHDWMGKSTGKGALSLWTHNLVSQEILQYNSTYYQGPALKVGAGVTSDQAAYFTASQGYRVVVGECATVGFAGGYTQGGGHSLLSGLYGLSADNVLEWEVITPSGDLLVATPTQNADLYWALSGGGGGNYGIVFSMTTRLFKDNQIASAYFGFSVDTAGGIEEFWDAVAVFTQELQVLVDNNGVGAGYFLENSSLTVFTLMASGYTSANLSTLLQPMVSALEKSGSGQITNASLAITLYESSGYFDLYNTTLSPVFAAEAQSPVMGGRFVSRSNMAANASGVLDSFRTAVENGTFYLGISAINTNSSVSVTDPVADNAVTPAWRDAFLSVIIGQTWSFSDDWGVVKDVQADLVGRILPALEAATPSAGAYMNEANWQQADWQDVFYGSNYQKLESIKDKYDPNGVLYGLTAVGSEIWVNDADGRLCRSE